MQYEKLKYRKKENAYPKSAKRQRDDARRQDMISYAEQELLETIVKNTSRSLDPNDVHSVGSSHVQITDIPRAAEGHNLLRD